MLPEFFEFYNPTKVVYEAGVAKDLKPELDIIGIKKYFIVSDNIINDLGLVQKVADLFTRVEAQDARVGELQAEVQRLQAENAEMSERLSNMEAALEQLMAAQEE